MSAPGSVKARSSVEIHDSCNYCCPFKKKKHHKRDKCDKAIQEVKEIATLQAIPSPDLRQPQQLGNPPIPRHHGSPDLSVHLHRTDNVGYQLMPTPASIDVSKQAEGSGKR